VNRIPARSEPERVSAATAFCVLPVIGLSFLFLLAATIDREGPNA